MLTNAQEDRSEQQVKALTVIGASEGCRGCVGGKFDVMTWVSVITWLTRNARLIKLMLEGM